MPHARNSAAAMQESTLATALGLIIESSANILEFYRHRDLLFNSGSIEALPRMRALAAREIGISLSMAELCAKDSRLGFHSEAMIHCFHPASLKWRASRLQEMLDGVMRELEQHCADGKSPWEFFLARKDAPAIAETGVWQQHDRLEWQIDAGCNVWRITFKYRPFREFVLYITDACGISFPSWIRCVPDANGTSAAIVEENLYPMSGEHNVLFNHVTVECSGDLAIMTVPAAALPPGKYFRLNLYASDSDGIHAAYGSPYPYRLCMASYSAEDAALLEK